MLHNHSVYDQNKKKQITACILERRNYSILMFRICVDPNGNWLRNAKLLMIYLSNDAESKVACHCPIDVILLDRVSKLKQYPSISGRDRQGRRVGFWSMLRRCCNRFLLILLIWWNRFTSETLIVMVNDHKHRLRETGSKSNKNWHRLLLRFS